MSAKIVGTFLRAALGPVQFAAGLITSNKIKLGLSELLPEPLEAALRRGIADVAALTGLRSSDIEAALPMPAFAAALARLKVVHAEAMAAWDLHAGPTGFMSVMTALTIDGRKPEIGLSIERVAKKLSQDKGLVEPLLALAAAIHAYEELISQAVTVLEGDGWLSRALLRRRLRRGLVIAIPLVLVVAFGVLAFRVLAGRSRLDEALSNPDACLAYAIPSSDRRFASDAQEAKIKAAEKTCDEARRKAAEEARIAEEKRAREEAIKAAEKARFDACSRVAAAVKDGSYVAGRAEIDGDVVPKDGAAFLERIAQKKLVASDLGPTEAPLPCPGTAFEKDVVSAFAKAVLANAELCKSLEAPSPLTERILTENKDLVPPDVARAVAEAAEESSKRSLTTGDRGALDRSKRVCHVARLLFTGELRYCAVVDKL